MTFIRRYILFCVAVAMILLNAACNSSRKNSAHEALADSLCNDIHLYRYKNPELLFWSASMLDSLNDISEEQNSIALNAKAYANFMRMDYLEASECYSAVIENAKCEIERLVAEVGMMQLCYRTSANKEFFDYRSSAIRRVRRITEEAESLPDGDRERFLAARVELSAVSLCYFANLGMEQEADRAASYLEKHIEQVRDFPLRIYARMMLNYRSNIPVESRIEALSVSLQRAKSSGQLWLVANCRLMLAILLRDGADAMGVPESVAMNNSIVERDMLPLHLALEAAKEFDIYGDEYMLIEALAVAASCNTQSGRFVEALVLLEDAMGLINSYYATVDADMESLSLSEVNDTVELSRMESGAIVNIPECLLIVRREASCAYAGLGDKPASDMNRNGYLDLLHATRLNRQMESRALAAEENASMLYSWFLILLLLLLAVVVGTAMLNLRWRRRNADYVAHLNDLLHLCRQLMTALPQHLDGEEDVRAAVERILNEESGIISREMSLKLLLNEENSVGEDDDLVSNFPLYFMDGRLAGTLCVASRERLSPRQNDMLQIALPYIAAAIEEGRRIADIGDESERIEQQRISYGLYLVEHKRENVKKRVALSLLGGMRPYMDRMLNELNHLAAAKGRGDAERERLDYLSELTMILDDYSAVLERWIKMRKGELDLHIENFSIAELLHIIAKGGQAFTLKGLELSVKESSAVVKADKALTLFMINTLAENAGKFTPRGGRVSVEALEGDGYVEIAVSDTGVGLSQGDIEAILNSKVYDASAIGRDSRLSSNKGGGFGLMNCKGIIEKYRKTDELFAVCRMDIASTPGKGSRFSFRLPRGVMRILSVLFCVMLSSVMHARHIERTASLADSVYLCNVEGRHADAILFAREAVGELNAYYRDVIGGVDTLSLYSGEISEIKWWRDAIFGDSLTEGVYYNLLDLRNETAVAALAMQEWQIYRYNNAIYTQLYRLVHEDSELALYYEKMRNVANYRQAAVVMCVALLLVLLVIYIVMYMRHLVVERMNNSMLLQMNERLLRLATGNREAQDILAYNMAKEIYDVMHEHIRLNVVSVVLRSGNMEQVATVPEDGECNELLLRSIMDSGKPFVSTDSLLHIFPLEVVTHGERQVIGLLAVSTGRPMNGGESTTLELIADYAASAAYHRIVRMEQKYNDLDEMEEEMERVKYEENLLHVRNLVIDNCLSVVKHETIYYPSRIRELVNRLSNDDIVDREWQDRVAAIRELMDYYNSVFGVLTACAARQLDESGFRISRVDCNKMFCRLERFVRQRSGKRGVRVELLCEVTTASLCGDADLIEYLFESLLGALLAYGNAGSLTMRTVDINGTLAVEIVDSRCNLSADEIATMFISGGRENCVDGMGFLIAKEIVRMHEDYMGRRGGRLEARSVTDGVVLQVVLPQW